FSFARTKGNFMSNANPLYRHLASLVQARINCQRGNNLEWHDKHTEEIKAIVNNGPCGSGIDNGTHIDLDASTGEKLVFYTGYHHMNEGGMYDGWTEHTITVKPSLQFGIVLSISGRDRNEIKEYLHEVYNSWLTDNAEVHI